MSTLISCRLAYWYQIRSHDIDGALGRISSLGSRFTGVFYRSFIYFRGTPDHFLLLHFWSSIINAYPFKKKNAAVCTLLCPLSRFWTAFAFLPVPMCAKQSIFGRMIRLSRDVPK